jgi:hypothetical protein
MMMIQWSYGYCMSNEEVLDTVLFLFLQVFFSLRRPWVLGFGFCTNCCWGSCWLGDLMVMQWSCGHCLSNEEGVLDNGQCVVLYSTLFTCLLAYLHNMNSCPYSQLSGLSFCIQLFQGEVSLKNSTDKFQYLTV